jgi:hypothetical protein
MVKPTRESDTKACHTMNQKSTNDKGIQMDEVRYGLQGHNNLASTNGTIDGNQVIKGYKGYNDDGIVDLHSCSRLKCTGEFMLMW